jgi:Mg2+/Co2+ transporter CorB
MLNNISITDLLLALLILLCVSAFFSGSETAVMILNRYRLRHLANQGNRFAKLVQKILHRPERLLVVILIGNTFANIMASSIATVLAVRLWGEAGVVISAVVLTLMVLIFAEITPKTLAIIYPQQISFLAAFPLWILLWLLYPVVWLGNTIANSFLLIFRIRVGRRRKLEALNAEELRTIVNEFGGELSNEDQNMVLSILELSRIKVEDIMLPKNEIVGIDLNDDWDDVVEFMQQAHQMRLPVFQGNIANLLGILQLKNALGLLAENELDKESLKELLLEPYFIPQGATLGTQLLNFRKNKKRSAFVVDEYGEIQGLVTLEEILEEIVGEFIVDIDTVTQDLHKQEDGSYIIDGSITLRELNKLTGWDFSLTGPKTLSGLIVEHLEAMPQPGTSMKINNHPIEIVQVKNNIIRTVKILQHTEKENE